MARTQSNALCGSDSHARQNGASFRLLRTILYNQMCLPVWFKGIFKSVMTIRTYRKLPISTITLAACICSLHLVSAAESDHPPFLELPATVVSAPRFMDVDMEIASRVQVIDQKAIEKSGATNLVDLLKSNANLHFRSTSGNVARSEISMGGFGENSGQRVLILLDGHRLNTADQGQINWLSIPIGLVESVEVIRGGQSALYGNNAVGGVIKINTRRPSEVLSGQAQASLGSFDSYNGRVALTGSEGSLGFSLHAEHDATEGYRENSQYEAEGGGLRLDWNPTRPLSFYGSFSAVSSEHGLPGPLTRAELEADRRQSTEPENRGLEDAYYFRGGAAYCIGDLWTLALDSAYTQRELFSDFVSSASSVEQDYEIISVSPSLTFDDGRLTAVLGLDYYDDGVDAVSVFFGVTPFDYQRQTLAGYASLSYDLGEAWILTASARYEEAETTGHFGGVDLGDVKEDAVSWSLGLIRTFDSQARVYGSVRQFYRYPATDEVLIFFPVLAFSPDLNPERGHEFEWGGDIIWDALTLGGRVYWMQMEDEVAFDPGIGLFGANTNLDDTERFGIDLNLSYAFTPDLTFDLAYSWVQAEIQDGDYAESELPLVPAHKLRLGVEYRSGQGWILAAGASYTADLYIGGDFNNEQKALGDYVLYDLNVRYQIREGLEVFVVVENLSDEEYVSTAFNPDALYPGTGRSGRIGLTWKF